MGTRSTVTVSREYAIRSIRSTVNDPAVKLDTLEYMLEAASDDAAEGMYNFTVDPNLQDDGSTWPELPKEPNE